MLLMMVRCYCRCGDESMSKNESAGGEHERDVEGVRERENGFGG